MYPNYLALQLQLRIDSDKISSKFDLLVNDAEDYLIHSNTSVSRLVSRISPSCDDTLILVVDDIDKAKNISEVFIHLKKKRLLSFINYKLMFRIVHLCNCEKLLQRLKYYESDFKEYMKRRVSENTVYKHGEFKPGQDINPAEGAKLLIITDNSWSSDRFSHEIEQLKMIVAEIFNIMDFGLALIRIEPSCLRLHYYISQAVGKIIFPLSFQQENKLRRYGINQVHYSEFHYTFTGIHTHP